MTSCTQQIKHIFFIYFFVCFFLFLNMPPFDYRTMKKATPLSLLVFFIILVNLTLIYRYTGLYEEPDLTIPPMDEEPTIPPYNAPQYGLLLVRPTRRKFVSPVLEKYIKSLEIKMKDKDLYVLLQNCLPNTLDTTVEWFNNDKRDPRTFLITGDSKIDYLTTYSCHNIFFFFFFSNSSCNVDSRFSKPNCPLFAIHQ